LYRADPAARGEGAVLAYDAAHKLWRQLIRNLEGKDRARDLVTGLARLDSFGGLHRRALTVIEAQRPEDATTLALYLAHSVSRAGTGTLLRAHREPLARIVDRMLRRMAQAATPLLVGDEFDRYYEAVKELTQDPLWILADGERTVAALERAHEEVRASAPKLAEGIPLVVVLDVAEMRGGATLALRRLRRLAQARNVAVVATARWSGELPSIFADGPDWLLRAERQDGDGLFVEITSGDGCNHGLMRLRLCERGDWIDGERSAREPWG
jgi:replicative DNA helicase